MAACAAVLKDSAAAHECWLWVGRAQQADTGDEGTAHLEVVQVRVHVALVTRAVLVDG